MVARCCLQKAKMHIKERTKRMDSVRRSIEFKEKERIMLRMNITGFY